MPSYERIGASGRQKILLLVLDHELTEVIPSQKSASGKLEIALALGADCEPCPWFGGVRVPKRECRKHLRQDECWLHVALLRRASALYCCASKIKLANPSRKSNLRRSASVLASNGRRVSLISGVICSVPRTLSACARSRISETEGGFSMLQPRKALASPAIPAWNSWLESGVLSATISASRSAVGCSTRR